MTVMDVIRHLESMDVKSLKNLKGEGTWREDEGGRRCDFCKQVLYRAKFNDNKDMLRCENLRCPRDRQLAGYVDRGTR